MNKYLLYCISALLLNCNSVERASPSVFFAGEIVNPTSKYVVLNKGSKVIDSALVDENNRFSFSFENLDSGLYYFNHAPEYQNVYLEQGDSLIIRLNTVDFDESLTFSGKGEEINHFLLELFLNKEKEEKLISDKWNALDPIEFSSKINVLRENHLKELSVLNEDGVLSENAYNIGRASIDYTYYAYREKYPFKHRKYTGKKKMVSLPSEFYSYRKNIDFNNSQFNYLKPYYNFMRSHFGNLSYTTCSNICINEMFEAKNKLHLNLHQLRLIDSLVVEKELKDNLFRNVAFNYLLKSHDTPVNNAKFIKVFHQHSKNNRYNKEIDALYSGIKNIQPNNTLPDLTLINNKDEGISLHEIARNKKVVFYFWSETDKRHYSRVFSRIKFLQKTNPNYTYVGINFRTTNESWKEIVTSNHLSFKNQYSATDFNLLTHSLIVYPLNKCIITENTKIVNAFGNIFGSF